MKNMMIRASILVAILCTLFLAMSPNIPVASASTIPRHQTAYRFARSQIGKPYVYGADGPNSYDCSGLVMDAYRHAGIILPRTTYEMLASSKLIRETHAQAHWGDLVFYGSGHVELYAGWRVTLGAHASGQPVSYITWGGSWRPTAYYRVRGAGG